MSHLSQQDRDLADRIASPGSMYMSRNVESELLGTEIVHKSTLWPIADLIKETRCYQDEADRARRHRRSETTPAAIARATGTGALNS
ncbi:hypothetical protein [Nonomuraea sp. KM90]|uniref:hypothetical protein n=1 Tax=Nonomuraea sp. KM90 TaxID=3457428 RepID=UPI003FCE7A38